MCVFNGKMSSFPRNKGKFHEFSQWSTLTLWIVFPWRDVNMSMFTGQYVENDLISLMCCHEDDDSHDVSWYIMIDGQSLVVHKKSHVFCCCFSMVHHLFRKQPCCLGVDRSYWCPFWSIELGTLHWCESCWILPETRLNFLLVNVLILIAKG